METCVFCNKEFKSKNAKTQHQIRCKDNPKAIEVKPSYGMLGKQGKNQYSKANDLGLPKPEVSEETRKKISKKQIGELNHWSKDTELKRDKHSKTMHDAVLRNPDSYSASNVCGRVKIVEYNGTKFHGQWEVEFAKWLDSKGIVWERPSEPFKYFWKDRWHLYFPDFFLPEKNLYVEVKGYETERDRCKWSVIPNLLTIKLNDLKIIRQGKFDGIVA